ncbi:MAG: FKBP-type peptidyl-prolyl cis-trans isomerase [Lachnospiraceae bacterium]|nr:FKBP-type peptidyl-prolyl cis-trans isomerase [Lachnospiraceae bacterium]
MTWDDEAGEAESSAETDDSEETDSTEEADSTEETEEATADSDESEATEEETAYSTDTSLTVADGDTVNIDYTGYIDDVAFDGGSTNGSGTDLTIGSGSYIDDFEEQLIGSHPGDTVSVTVTFPEDYGNEELNGQEAVFEVTINGIYQ